MSSRSIGAVAIHLFVVVLKEIENAPHLPVESSALCPETFEITILFVSGVFVSTNTVPSDYGVTVHVSGYDTEKPNESL